MALLDRYQQRMGQLRDATSSAVGTAWDDLGSYNEADVDRFLARTGPVVAASQAHAVVLTDAYFAAETGRSPLGLPIDSLTGAGVRNGAPPAEVYRRPFVQVWKALKEGTDWADAVSAARARVAGVASTDVQLSMRAATAQVLEQDHRIVGYRRVLTGKSCAFCATASTQRYTAQNLMPIHGSCDCGVAPIYGDRDPGRVVNRKLLNDLKVGGGPQYWKDQGITVDEAGQVVKADGPLRVAVHDHGELGPVLGDADHEFTSL